MFSKRRTISPKDHRRQADREGGREKEGGRKGRREGGRRGGQERGIEKKRKRGRKRGWGGEREREERKQALLNVDTFKIGLFYPACLTVSYLG